MCRGSARKSKRRGSAGVRVRWPPVPGGRNGLNCALSDRRLEVSMSHAVAVPVLTIDGPSGSGKGTVSAMVAERLGWRLLDSGALYRAVGFAAGMAGLDLSDVEAVTRCARTTKIQFRAAQNGNGTRLVADGHDMGTVIFPDAAHKVFLTASAAERAKRRYKQLKEKGLSVTLAGLQREIEARDSRDASRAVAPLKPADDAVLVDTTGMGIDEVVAKVLAVVQS